MKNNPKQNSLLKAALGMSAAVIIFAGLKAASSIIVPFLLAGFIAIICAIPLFWLRKKGVPSLLAILIVFLTVGGVGTGIGLTVVSSIKKFTAELPTYKESLQSQTEELLNWVTAKGLDVSEYQNVVTDLFNPSSAIDLAGGALRSAGGMLTNGLLVMLIVIFILLEAAAMPSKLKRALPSAETTLAGFQEFTKSVKQYLIIKCLISGITGIVVGISLWIIGVDFPLLWALLAFAFNFVPTVGSVIAAIPPILLAVVQLGPSAIIPVGACYLTVNVLMGSVLEPRIMGEGVGLSPLVVFISLIFWGWILGPVGMLLSVPLTMIVKIACLSSDTARPVGILLGPADKKTPSTSTKS